MNKPFRPLFDLRRKPPYPSKPEKPWIKGKRLMTVAIGFNCVDGVVLGADSEMTGGISKWADKKIHSFLGPEFKSQPHFAYTTDDVDFAKNVVNRLASAIKTAEKGNSQLIPAVKGELKKIHKEYSRIYPKKEERPVVEILLALYDPEPSLYVLRGVEATPVSRAEYIGWGDLAARSTADPLFSPELKTYEAASLATYGIFMAKEYAKYVGKPSHVVMLQRRSEVIWGPTVFWLKQEEIQEMESDFKAFLGSISPVLCSCYFETYEDPKIDKFEEKLKTFTQHMKKQHRKYIRRAKRYDEEVQAVLDEIAQANSE